MAKEKQNTKDILNFYWGCIRKYPGYVIGISIASPLTTLINNFIPPLILANVLNRLSEHNYKPHRVWASFGPDLVGYALLVIFGGGIAWRIVDFWQWRLEGKVERDIARKVFNHLMNLSSSFHANTFGGSLVSQTSKLMGSYIRFSDTSVFQIIPMISSLIFAAIILSRRAPLYVAVLIVFSIFYIVSSFLVTRNVRRLSAKQAAAESIQTGYLSDMVSNIMAVKSFSASKFESKQFRKITNNTHDRLIDLSRGHQRQQIFFGGFTGIISGSSLTVAVIAVMVFNADLATMFLILNYTASIVGQLFTFSNSTIRTVNRAFGDATDMVRILNLTPEVQDPVNPEPLRINKGNIKFQNITFRHEGNEKALFSEFNLDIRPGEKIGLVGHSGSGKSTFTRLLLRFSDIQAGEILIDDQNIANITQDDLRKTIAYVPQEPLLFHRTISENISYGSPVSSEEEIVGAAKLANANEFIIQLPQGYDTLVGERGVKLSGGQRQRVAIARAMLKNAPILLLDEATSALDSESEILIQDALWKLMEGRTTIVIAHRLSTIQKMDRIIVLDEGKVVEEGSHQELISKQGGTYAKLWAHQSGGFIDE